jgi:putative ABC transport system permease protein
MPPPPNSNATYFAGIRLVPSTMMVSFFGGFLATPLTALLPARRLSRMPVVDALRMN